MPIINGKKEDFENINLNDLIEKYGIKKDFVVIELNGEIIPKDNYEEVYIASDDNVEVISFVGGG